MTWVVVVCGLWSTSKHCAEQRKKIIREIGKLLYTLSYDEPTEKAWCLDHELIAAIAPSTGVVAVPRVRPEKGVSCRNALGMAHATHLSNRFRIYIRLLVLHE
jgi:hypothetical protein